MKQNVKPVVKHNKERQSKYAKKFTLDTDFDTAIQVLVGRKKPTSKMVHVEKH